MLELPRCLSQAIKILSGIADSAYGCNIAAYLSLVTPNDSKAINYVSSTSNNVASKQTSFIISGLIRYQNKELPDVSLYENLIPFKYGFQLLRQLSKSLIQMEGNYLPKRQLRYLVPYLIKRYLNLSSASTSISSSISPNWPQNPIQLCELSSNFLSSIFGNFKCFLAYDVPVSVSVRDTTS